MGKTGIELPPVNNSVSPIADFYGYVNNRWQGDVQLPSYDSSYSVSEEIEDEVRNVLLKEIHTLQEKKPNHPIAKVATSFLHHPHQKNSLLTLNAMLGSFECIQTKEELGHALGQMNRWQTNCPLSLVVSGDSYKTAECCVFLYEPTLGLPSKRFYRLKPHTHSNTVLSHYTHMLKHMGDILYQPDFTSVVDVERGLINVMSTYDEQYDISFTYNPYTYAELQKAFSLPWSNIFEAWGLTDPETKTFVVTNKRYFTYLSKLVQSLPLETWKAWLRVCTVLSFLEYLPPPFDDMHFELYGKLLKGNHEKLPQKYLMLRVLKKFMCQDLGKFFVETIIPGDTKREALKLVAGLRKATIRRLERVDWMDSRTRKHAIQKVKDMKFQVAYPNTWTSETKHTVIEEDQPLQNILNLSIYDTEAMIQDMDCKKDVNNWEDGCFEVNAFYYSEGNMMVIPAGILQPPFFDLQKSDAWNLGAIGSAVGHEITHGFDTDGRMYDASGNYRNWWLQDDENAYMKLTTKIVQLFHNEEYMHGKINGELTLSENLADLGGMSIAMEALQSILAKEKATDASRKKAYRDFFISYAISWRNKDRPKKALESLKSDAHAPAKFRVNKIVVQFDEFYEAFGIGETDPGFLPSANRIKLW